MVPETGLEPAHQMAYAPKAYVYTNFTTRARFARPRLRERALTLCFDPRLRERALTLCFDPRLRERASLIIAFQAQKSHTH